MLLLINISLFILCCNLALEELYYLRILSLNVKIVPIARMDEVYTIISKTWV